MTETQKKFEDTYGSAEPIKVTAQMPVQEETAQLKTQLKSWGRRLMGIVSVALVITGLVFGLAVFLIIGAIFLLGTLINALLFSKPSSKNLMRR